MKQVKLWMTFFLLTGLSFLNNTPINAAGCTQKRKPCWNSYPGYALYCTGPVATTDCYSGGCGGPVDGPVECADDPIE